MPNNIGRAGVNQTMEIPNYQDRMDSMHFNNGVHRGSVFKGDDISLRLKDSRVYHPPPHYMDPNMSYPSHANPFGMEMPDVEVEDPPEEDFLRSLVHSIASFKLEGGEETDLEQ